MLTSRTLKTAALVVAGAVALAVAVWIWPEDRPRRHARDQTADEAPLAVRDPDPEPESRTAPSTTAPTTPSRTVAPVTSGEDASGKPHEGPDDDRWPDEVYAVRTVDALIERLSSDDPHIVLDAVDGLRARNAVEAIPNLADLDIAASPDSARTVIDALGKLAGAADPGNQKTATDRLIALLAQEKARPSPDAPGNVLQIYEALGDTRDPRAASALEAELSDPSVPLAALVVVIEALAKLNQASSIKPLSEARVRVAALTFDDAFLMEVRSDVLAALDAALSAR